MVPGWPYSIVAALETGCTSWTAVLDAVRLEPGADVVAVTTAQIREVVEQLVSASQRKPGDPEVLVVLDAGCDAPRIAHLLNDLPVEILGRLRSDRVMRRPTPPRVYDPKGGRPPKHGDEFGPFTVGLRRLPMTRQRRATPVRGGLSAPSCCRRAQRGCFLTPHRPGDRPWTAYATGSLRGRR
ncbi:hypothetical protein GCM10010244_85400 [Streptomyces coeruleorubidus]|nr:hypothetical protein GCM10010244_85400 [Streptomyces bellus]